MKGFLSEEEILKHKEYLKTLNLRFSIFEKSVKNKGNPIEVIRALRGEERKEAERLYSSIKLHELFFFSFTDNKATRSDRVRAQYGSEASLLYSLYKLGLKSKSCFLSVVMKGEKIIPALSEDYFYLLSIGRPLLTLDLYEHAYYRDYGFCKEKYLESALIYLDLTKL